MTARALVLVLLLAPTAALADGAATLESARRSYQQLRYDEAAALLEGALEGGALAAAEREEALLLAGILGVIRGDDDVAREHFRELLEQAPDTTLPAGLSPKITRVFEEVRASVVEAAPPREAPPDERSPAVVALAPPSVPASGTPSARPERPATVPPREAEDDGSVSAIALGVAAGAALTAVVVVASAGAVLFFARGQPPPSSLGTMQLP